MEGKTQICGRLPSSATTIHILEQKIDVLAVDETTDDLPYSVTSNVQCAKLICHRTIVVRYFR
jgi:hypothetical protein